MSAQIRRVGVVLAVLFASLFVNLNLTQLVRSDELANNPANRRLLVREYSIRRGAIVAGEEQIAHSEPTSGELEYLRVYERPELWGHITGYYSFVLGRSGLEAALNEALTGTPTELLAQNLAELLGAGAEVGNTVRLTLDPAVQAAAARALGDRIGAVVALDPTTGAVLALHSSPGYDPNLLSSHDASEILDAWERLQGAPDRPLLNRATRETYPPGSTFKLVVAAAALERGLGPETALEDGAEFQPEVGQPIRNFGGGACTEAETISLADALRVSCNTAFAALGTRLGAEALAQEAADFGFGLAPPLELPTVQSQFPDPGGLDAATLALSSIGQFDVRTTPLQMAMITAAIVNDGRLVRPYLVAEILDPSLRTVRGPQAGPWTDPGDAEAVSDRTAQLLAEMMIATVENGTGTAAQIGGVQVGGKTGTSQVPGESSTVWFTGFVEDRVAVAVVLPDAGASATGGGEAAPVARAVMEAALGQR